MGREGPKAALPLHPLNGTERGQRRARYTPEQGVPTLNPVRRHMQSRIPTYIFSLIIPLALVIGCFGFYNRVEPRILGFPFIYAWIFACFFLVSASMCIGWLLDPQSDRNKKRASSSRAPKENAS